MAAFGRACTPSACAAPATWLRAHCELFKLLLARLGFAVALCGHAEADAPCRCTNAVGRIERVTRDQGLFISPATLQSYKSVLHQETCSKSAPLTRWSWLCWAGTGLSHWALPAQHWRTCSKPARSCSRSLPFPAAQRQDNGRPSCELNSSHSVIYFARVTCLLSILNTNCQCEQNAWRYYKLTVNRTHHLNAGAQTD